MWYLSLFHACIYGVSWHKCPSIPVKENIVFTIACKQVQTYLSSFRLYDYVSLIIRTYILFELLQHTKREKVWSFKNVKHLGRLLIKAIKLTWNMRKNAVSSPKNVQLHKCMKMHMFFLAIYLSKIKLNNCTWTDVIKIVNAWDDP